MPSKTAEPELTTWESTWSVASSQMIHFPLCQIFSVLLMGMCAPRLRCKRRIREMRGGVNRWEVPANRREKTNWRGEAPANGARESPRPLQVHAQCALSSDCG